jgi:hypothetical protein
MADLLTAKERDLRPLVRESAEALALDNSQIAGMETFLTEAWFSGTYAGHAQMRAEAIKHRPAGAPVPIEGPKVDLEALIFESAGALNLPLPLTVCMWDFLRRALIAGIHAYQDTIMARLIETRADVAEEALRWLEDREADR